MIRFVFITIILSAIGVVSFASLTLLAGEIDEQEYADDAFGKIIDVLPINSEVLPIARLPLIEEKLKVKKIVINLSAQKMFLYENEVVVKELVVSTGKPGMETPVGVFQIYNKKPRVWSSYGLWMPYWMAVAPDGRFGIHELPEWPGGIREGADHLGKPVSHGCIRLGIGAAQSVYEWAEVGMEVLIIK